MELLSIALFIVIVVLIVSLRKAVLARLTAMESEIASLRKQVLTGTPGKMPAAEASTLKKDLSPPAAKPIPQAKDPLLSISEEASIARELKSMLEQAPPQNEGAVLGDENNTGKPAQPVKTLASYKTAGAQKKLPATPKKPSFLERNPDLEKFIGENLISKIGIAILVLAIGYFVKYAIDNDWIGAVGRVGIGILCGAILAAVAHRLRNSYKAFSSVLTGGGLAIFYFTITLAYHQFHLFSQVPAFIIMVVITAFAVVLSQLYDRQELAVIALIGGFATPFMAGNNSGSYLSLFIYLIVLNAGLLIIAYNKAWRLLNMLAFAFTAILFASWLYTLAVNVSSATYRNGFFFATIFYLLFFLINIAHNVRENKKFIASDFGILLCNTGLYFAAGLYCLAEMNAQGYNGLFSVSMGTVNLVASLILFRNRKTDNNILYLLIGITLSFISLTAPIQLHGHFITLFWACESVLLYWLFQKSGMAIMRTSSLVVWLAMMVSLFMDWSGIYGQLSAKIPIIFNKGFITSLFAAIASYAIFYLKLRAAPTQNKEAAFLPGKSFYRLAGLLLLFAGGALEISYQFRFYYPGTNLVLVYLLLFAFSYVTGFILLSRKANISPVSPLATAILYALCLAMYLLTIPAVFSIQARLLIGEQFAGHFFAHWAGAILVAIIYYLLIQELIKTKFGGKGGPLAWLLCAVLVIFVSAEVQLLVNQLFYAHENSLEQIQRIYIKTGLPILWGLSSFAFMWAGMKYQSRSLRIISLTLFLVILLKLFILDIRNIPAAGRIAAFFSLGVLLLIVSFMYQRLKKIIIEDEKKPSL